MLARTRALFIASAVAAPGASEAMAQDPLDAPHVPQVRTALPLDSSLLRFGERVTRGGREPAEEARRFGYRLSADGRINVEIVGPTGARALGSEDLPGLDVRVDVTWRHRTNAWVRPAQLSLLAGVLPEGFWLHQVLPPDVDDAAEDEFAAATNAVTYKVAGADGTGVRIAVIDTGFENLGLAQDAGQAPVGDMLHAKSYVGDADADEEGSGWHGTACLETVFDHAPGAEYFIYRTHGLTATGAAVDHALANGVTVFSMSRPFYNKGWFDDEGDACALALEAASNGALFFTSAGNRAGGHWQGTFVDADGDDWHEFAGSDETIDITMGEGGGGNFYVSWNDATDVDYDVFLYDESGSEVACGVNGAPNQFENFHFKKETGSTETFQLRVRRISGASVEFEVFLHGSNFDEHKVAEGSSTTPSNTTHPSVISCGAVKWTNWDLPAGTPENTSDGFPNESSSRGPSNGGMILPDLASATGNLSAASGAPFGGTSCATPNAAGIAASFWSEFPDMTSAGVRHCLFEQAAASHDWGPAGADNVFGRGGIYLHPYAPDTAFLSASYYDWVSFLIPFGGWTGDQMLGPFLRLEDAQTYAGAGGRLVLLPGEYPGTAVLSEPLRLEATEVSALAGS